MAEITFAEGVDLAEPALCHGRGALVNLVPEHDDLGDLRVEKGRLVGQEYLVHHPEDEVLHAGGLGRRQRRAEQLRVLPQHA